jgi:hypothetical protein
MNDALDDLAMMRAAGAGPVFEDTEHLYPPAKWAAHPGAMPTVADIINERNHWRTGYEVAIAKMSDMEQELENVRGWLARLIGMEPNAVGVRQGSKYLFCLHCKRETSNQRDEDDHAPDCPWRLAAEYVQKMEASNATHPA